VVNLSPLPTVFSFLALLELVKFVYFFFLWSTKHPPVYLVALRFTNYSNPFDFTSLR